MVWCAYWSTFYFNLILMYTNHSDDNNFIVPLIEVTFFTFKIRDYDFFHAQYTKHYSISSASTLAIKLKIGILYKHLFLFLCPERVWWCVVIKLQIKIAFINIQVKLLRYSFHINSQICSRNQKISTYFDPIFKHIWLPTLRFT